MRSLKHYTPVNLKTKKRRVKATLNIPKSLLPVLEAELKQRNMSMAAFLHFLLAQYGKLLVADYYRLFLPSSMDIFTSYQKRGQQLVQEYIRVAPEDWAMLGTISIAVGASRSLVFVHCLRLLVFGASNVLPNAQTKRSFWRALSKKERLVRLEASVFLDRATMEFCRKHRLEFEKPPDLVGKIENQH